MRPRDRLATTPWRDDHPWPSLIERVALAQKPQGTVPESWVAGLKECVRSGYVDRPDSFIPLANPSYLRKVAPTVMATPGDRGFLGFGVFVAWCCDLRRGAIADFPEVDTRADPDPEVTMLARCLDVAMTSPSWSRYTSPRLGRVLAERVSGRLVSEVPDLVDLAQAARRGPDGPPSSSLWDGLALSAIWRWQDAILDDVESMGAADSLWYRVLDAWRAARMVTGSARAGARAALAGDDAGAPRHPGDAGQDGACGLAFGAPDTPSFPSRMTEPPCSRWTRTRRASTTGRFRLPPCCSGSNGARLRDTGAGAGSSAGDGRCFTASP